MSTLGTLLWIPIDPYKAAIGAVHLVLGFITLWPVTTGKNDGDVPPPD